jgi:hypothetical protein
MDVIDAAGLAFRRTKTLAAPNRDVEEESARVLHVPIVSDHRAAGRACNDRSLIQLRLQCRDAHCY